jgi:hypothetical protein
MTQYRITHYAGGSLSLKRKGQAMSSEAERRAGMTADQPFRHTNVTGYDAWPLTDAMREHAKKKTAQTIYLADTLRLLHANGHTSCAYRDLKQGCTLSDIHFLTWLGVLKDARTEGGLPFFRFTPYVKSWVEMVLAT